jgi:hypothetical protein
MDSFSTLEAFLGPKAPQIINKTGTYNLLYKSDPGVQWPHAHHQ